MTAAVTAMMMTALAAAAELSAVTAAEPSIVTAAEPPGVRAAEPPSVAAEPPWRGLVVVLVPAVDDAVTRNARARIAGELAAAPFKTITAPIDPMADLSAQVETVGSDRAATAAFAIVRTTDPGSTDGRVTIWVSNRVTGTMTIQRMRVDEQDIDRAASQLAVEAVELVRASLEGVWPAPAAATPAAPPVRAARVVLDVGAGLLADLGGGPSFWTTRLAATYALPAGVGLRLALGGLGPGADVTTDRGSAHLDIGSATLGLTRTFRAERTLRPTVSVAAGACHLAARGTAAAASPALAHDRAAWSAVTSAGGGLAVALGPRVALSVEAEAVILWSALAIEIADREAARLDHLALSVHTGLLVAF